MSPGPKFAIVTFTPQPPAAPADDTDDTDEPDAGDDDTDAGADAGDNSSGDPAGDPDAGDSPTPTPTPSPSPSATDGAQNMGPAAITLEGPLVLTAGLKPNVWSAKISYPEFQKLNGQLAVQGTLGLWYNNSPAQGGKADVSIEGVSICDVQIGSIGTTPGGSAPIVTEYKLSLCDSRDRFVDPRGGRLRYGIVNPTRPLLAPGPMPTPTQSDDGTWTMTLSDMIVKCLETMGVTNTTVPDGLDAIPAPQDVKWFGNHAPTELGKLLEVANCVYCPNLDGTGQVRKIGDGDMPSYGDDALPVLKIPAMDRRGAAVIFSSYPTRVTCTEDITGPDTDTWQFVVNAGSGWTSIDDQFGAGGLATIVKAGFVGQPAYVSAQAYRFIRLSPAYVPPSLSPALTSTFDMTGKPAELYIVASVVQQDQASGLYSNTGGAVQVPAQFLAEGNVFQLATRIGQVSQANVSDPNLYFQEIANNSMTLHVAYEDCFQYGAGNDWAPSYFHCGFKLVNGSLVDLSDDEIGNALNGGAGSRDTFVICRPDFRARTYNGADQNQSTLVGYARSLAMQYLANSETPTQLASARGFQVAQISGLVSEIRWDQEALRTDALILNWWQPSGAVDVGAVHALESQKEGEAYPHQSRTQGTRAALGESGSSLPVAPVQPYAPPVAGVPPGGQQYQILVKQDSTGISAATWGWVQAHA